MLWLSLLSSFTFIPERFKLSTSSCWVNNELIFHPSLDACQLTLDQNTAYRQLYLSRGNRKAALKRDPQSYPDSPARFDSLPQVLCKEPLSGGAYYWEVDWSGEGASIGIAYKGIKRTGYGDSCRIGYNRKSWSLFCSDSSYSARHNKDQQEVNAPYSSRIGVFLDHAGGTLSFYTVGETMSLIHRFKASFSEPVYPGFWVWYESAITIIQLWLSNTYPKISGCGWRVLLWENMLLFPPLFFLILDRCFVCYPICADGGNDAWWANIQQINMCSV